ncbi:hypothetical protein LJ707_09090 [Mucilaginibacter sp. UR6-1]|uniref:hypothetical protein n=1 Tax=Mucilaginibacter sp. UR6-1 TaxID=1435643 RepID=UPI001E385598|nr:hypothetical protein [Mucilaginibacter sp. UR6-1]MCC8409084.1 hypothetical protein [Mucilaginibacter sp. UR6-1]
MYNWDRGIFMRIDPCAQASGLCYWFWCMVFVYKANNKIVNRYQMHAAFPFLTRPMNKQEIEYHHFDTRLCYHQYEDWEKLLYVEEQEAQELDVEQAGSGTDFLQKLRSFRIRYPLQQAIAVPVPVASEQENSDSYLLQLILEADDYTISQIGEMLGREQQGEKRLAILILL